MAASVNLPEPAPLPPRPSLADVSEALDFATAGRPDGPLRILAAEVLHLRRALEEKGGELGSLKFQAGEVARAWMSDDVYAIEEKGSALTNAISELAELVGEI